MNQTHPLVSCILPTYNRKQLIPETIRQFISQTYPSKELVIVDDGDQSCESIVGKINHPNIKYIRWNDKISIGRKRNIACENSSGEYIAHWDDDDWYSPYRLAEQIDLLKRTNVVLTGYNSVMMYNKALDRAIHYWEDPYCLVGASFVYRKDYWTRNRFIDQYIGEDTHFMRRISQTAMIGSPGIKRFVIIDGHGANISDRQFDLWLARYPEVLASEVHNLIGRKPITIIVNITSSKVKNVPDVCLESCTSEVDLMKDFGYSASLVVKKTVNPQDADLVLSVDPSSVPEHLALVKAAINKESLP